MSRDDPRVRNLVGQMPRSVAAAAPQGDDDLRMMRIVGYASEGQPGGGLLVPECAPTSFQVGFTAIIRPGHLSKKSAYCAGPLCFAIALSSFALDVHFVNPVPVD